MNLYKLTLSAIIGFLIIIFPEFLSAQLNDGFNDGDFTDNPEWIGNTGSFIVNPSQQLQLNSSGDRTAYLSSAISSSTLSEWRVLVNLAFSPSDNNNARIYLASDQADITNALNGYYLKLGENLSADAIELYKQTGTSAQLICRGTEGLLAAAFTVRIRVVRTSTGMWNIYADASGGEDFQFQASGEDATWGTYSYFGVFCKFTSSNATKFFFDDVYAGPLLFDNIKPVLLNVDLSGSSGLILNFSEPVSEASATNTANYSVGQGIGNPVSANRDDLSANKVNLLFSQPFVAGTVYSLSTSNVADLAGNIMDASDLPFSFSDLHPFDVVINEIMADPEPVVGLPAFEYLELYNRSDFPVQLENWTLTLGTTEKTLTQKSLPAHAYLILCHNEAASQLSVYGDVMSFSSFSLVNTGTTLVLRDDGGAVIHTVSYTDSWYQNSIKKNGGWSLEMIDAFNPCAGAGNWRASNATVGGSPGAVNSINGSNPDQIIPSVQKISITGESQIRVFFDEPMDSLSIADPALYSVDQGLGTPVTITVYPPDYRSVSLSFTNTIAEGIIYTLSLEAGFTDCAGNANTNLLTARFAIPALIDSLDVIINEVLYDPKTSGTDFVEIYNRSEKVVDLKTLWLASRDAVSGELESIKEVVPEGRLMFPGEYVVLSVDGNKVMSEYFTPAPNAFVDMESFPSFSNEAGTVVLLTPQMMIADEFTYSAAMQFALLITTDGVSLERISPDKSTADPANWHSASQNVGFATPGYQNSQYLKPAESGDEIVVSPEIFSPDNDGYNDLLSIDCNFSDPGYSVTIRIFDSNGYQIKMLVKNEPAGTTNQFIWDGINDDHEKAPIGIYIIYVEVFNLSGKVKQFKKAAVLGGKI